MNVEIVKREAAEELAEVANVRLQEMGGQLSSMMKETPLWDGKSDFATPPHDEGDSPLGWKK